MKPKVKAPSLELISKTHEIIEKYGVNTVCFASKCPNIAECFSRKSATFMILGDKCTRNCLYCNIVCEKPANLDENEPFNVAKAISSLNLNYVVITSVDRDDLKDFGSSHFAKTIDTIKRLNPHIKIEALTPDFKGDVNALNKIVTSNVYKLSHNIETVKKLHKTLKPQSSYKTSLAVLEYYSKFKITKSSIIVGFGESIEEIEECMRDLINAGVSQLTIGQYLRPSPKHYPVKKTYSKEEFEMLKNLGLSLGFKSVVSGILVRSSYYADKL